MIGKIDCTLADKSFAAGVFSERNMFQSGDVPPFGERCVDSDHAAAFHMALDKDRHG